MMQKSIKNIVSFAGVGLHSGNNVNVRILPAAEDTGIIFVRTDVPGSQPIQANVSNVVATNYATSLGVNGVKVSTVEHILAAFYGLGIDNAVVELDGPELPALDGSAELLVSMIEGVGVVELESSRKYMVIKEPIKVTDGDKHLLLLPASGKGLEIDYSIDFSHPILSKQTYRCMLSGELFKTEIASARTFGFLRDVEMLRANGLAKGGSLHNAVVIGETEVLNEGGLRYPDEFVRHKVLDLMGDLSLVGSPVVGYLIANRSGHALNAKLANKILSRPSSWEYVDYSSDDDIAGVQHDFIQKTATL
ncbi:MAG: UDP-3-O-acyl-N-acetylglucosamine deacetylase [Proteobacteria bacterium]|nr:UDP-3-O-acyl-N-acetylglucosamine deacetylase [Pseudomonadota bacterium]